MATNVVMPQMGYDMREGTVVRWYKQEGETVDRGEVIADIETDKATVEFEAYTGGVLGRIVAEAGVAVPVGELIAIITEPGESVPEVAAPAAAPAPASAAVPAPAAVDPEPPAAPAPASDGGVRASPIARRLARERGIDLSLVAGTGPNGRITERDVENYQAAPAAAEPAPAPAPAVTAAPSDSRIELSRMRQTIARVTSDSKSTAPHFYVTAEIDMGKAMALRRDVNDESDPENRVSVNDLMVKACALALARHPKFNSFFRGDHLEVHGAMNIGIAIALESGLILPGVSNCESKSLVQIAAATKDLIARANSGTLRNEEYSSTTFSISNMGMFDVESFTAIIYPPHAAILAVGSVKQQPVVRDGELAVGTMMKATLSTDHRVADGAEAAQFLMEIKRVLENPVSLLL
ncbi:MAG: dihydrolipoamide acetyltransferase family protein [Chloroflexota bacterium]|nr:dihydrolipoamide acetyltransferase family protein [Chloroflexota bacterium]MDE2959196.1 dihydrolipoamide acetyltransferase family protein [Chloroflexota bacterium]